MIEHALRLAAEGFRVLPLAGKIPRTLRGVKDATQDEDMITKWWTRWPEADIGLATGDGLVVLDIDPRHNGDFSLQELEDEHGEIVTRTVRTGGGGLHMYFRGQLPQRTGFREGLDMKADGGYVVAPPSSHESGGGYQWIDPAHEIRPVPDWLVGIVMDRNGAASGVPEVMPDAVPEGQRNHTLASIAGTMRKRGVSSDAIYAALTVENAKRCRPPMSDPEVRRIADSVGSYAYEYTDTPEAEAHGAETWQRIQQAKEEERSRPLFTLAEASVSTLIDTVPPEVRWLIPGVLPLGVVGILGATGGIGKSTSVLMHAICIAMGRGVWGWDTPDPGGVLILSAEDDRDEVHRRIHRVLDHLASQMTLDVDAVRARLFVACRVGADNLLTRVEDRTVVRTGMAERIAASALQVPDLRLIVPDPLARFRAGGANGEEEATRFVEALEEIRSGTGATVLVPAHVGKGSTGRGMDDLQDAIRGSSALVDGARWVATMIRMAQAEAKERGIPEDEAVDWVRFEVPKNNYGPRVPGVWLKRTASGILDVEEPPEQDALPRKADQQYGVVLGRLRAIIEKGGPAPRVKFRHMAGAAGPLGVGDQTVRAVIERAVQEGELTEEPDEYNGRIQNISLPVGGPDPVGSCG